MNKMGVEYNRDFAGLVALWKWLKMFGGKPNAATGLASLDDDGHLL